VLEMMSLLDTELMPAAARCEDETARAELKALLGEIEAADTPEARIGVEEELHNIIFRMVDRPLFELSSPPGGRLGVVATKGVHRRERFPSPWRPSRARDGVGGVAA